ncbi:MAG: hypothetical protein IPK63_18240 [Candidatus Competibacteraceae bacterium]|nr:hypothetical protein [Candidatus Competibacteraceae bacterium]
MKAFILAACAVAAPCLADDGITWITPHVVDTGVSLAVLQSVPGAVELNPLGFPGVVVAKFALEGIALGYRDAGDVETCQSIASGARWGGWIGTGATLGSLAAGPVGLAIGGLGAGLLSWQWSQDSAKWTCSQPPPLADYAPYSYSGADCMGWNDARPDFCNDWSFR